LYFVTFNTHRRRKLLANASVQNELIRFAQEGQLRGIGIGRYVVMPDHIHLFVRGNLDFSLKQRVRMMKRARYRKQFWPRRRIGNRAFSII